MAPAPAARAGDALWNLKLEGGSEYDTNIHRFELVDDSDDAAIVSSPLLRAGTRLRVRWRSSNRTHQIGFAGFGGAKLYGDAVSGQDENVLITAGDLRYDHRLADRSSVVGVRVSGYDTSHYNLLSMSTPVVEPRHYSTALGAGSVSLLGPGDHRFTIAGGYRGFRYKPNPNFDWRGEFYGARYQTTMWRGDPDEDLDAASIDIGASYEVQRRRYRGEAFTNTCPDDAEPSVDCFAPLGLSRVDLYHLAAAELVYTGDRIYGVRYQLEVTDSNSFGQSLVRQRLELDFTTELAARIFLNAKAAVQLDIFLDSLLLARDIQAEDFTAIDDENRNTLSIHLSRDVTDRWSVESRYAIYTNEFATREARFRRQVFYLGLVYQYARR